MEKKSQDKEPLRDKVEFRLPSDSAEFLQELLKEADYEAESMAVKINPYLAHNRFYTKITKYKTKPANRDNPWPKKPSECVEGSLLFSRLKQGTIADEVFCNKDLKGLLEMLKERNKELFRYFQSGKKYDFKPAGKLICGAGGESPYGNIQLIVLHPIYGIPYIPASAVKGALRDCWIVERFEGDEGEASADKEFQELFGTAEGENAAKEGKLVFFDTFPLRFTLALDVQTPHFQEYYSSGTIPPTDDQGPVPIFFTCVQDTEFNVYIACREKAAWDHCHKSIDEMMIRLFRWYGIGAKTSLGYGME